MGQLPLDDFNVLWTLGQLLPCVARQAVNGIEDLWRGVERLLEEDTAHPFALPMMALLRERPPPPARLRPVMQRLMQHPACSVRAGALRLMLSLTEGSESRNVLEAQARAALKEDCWRLQLAARDVLRATGAPFSAGDLPLFLRDAGVVRPENN